MRKKKGRKFPQPFTGYLNVIRVDLPSRTFEATGPLKKETFPIVLGKKFNQGRRTL